MWCSLLNVTIQHTTDLISSLFLGALPLLASANQASIQLEFACALSYPHRHHCKWQRGFFWYIQLNHKSGITLVSYLRLLLLDGPTSTTQALAAWQSSWCSSLVHIYLCAAPLISSSLLFHRQAMAMWLQALHCLRAKILGMCILMQVGLQLKSFVIP